MEHIFAYHGSISSLAVMQEGYGQFYVPGVNLWDEGLAGSYTGPTFFPHEFKNYVEFLQKNKNKEQVFAILKHEEENGVRAYRYIGQMGIHSMRWPDGVGTTGFIIIDPSSRGVGIGTDAQLNTLRHGFERLGLRKITANVKAFNGNSLGTLYKCGYRECGRYTRHIYHKGTFVDEVLLEVFPENFWPIWERYKTSGELPKLTDEQRTLIKGGREFP